MDAPLAKRPRKTAGEPDADAPAGGSSLLHLSTASLRAEIQRRERGGREEVDHARDELVVAKDALSDAQTRVDAAEAALRKARTLRILVVGFGNFGQFIGKTFVKQGHIVMGQSRGDYTAQAERIGARYTRNMAEALAFEPHVVVLCMSIMSARKVLGSIPLEKLAGRLVVDVLSVKEYPKTLLLKQLPPSADILCTHPMFGPESGKHSWQNLPFVYEAVRVTAGRGQSICDEFLHIWAHEGCKMVKMTCEQHDAYAASSQFITHTTGRLLASIEPALTPTPIDTKGYESLLGVLTNTMKDSFDLYCGLFYYNHFSKRQLDRLQHGLAEVRSELEAFEKEEELKEGGPTQRWDHLLKPSDKQ